MSHLSDLVLNFFQLDHYLLVFLLGPLTQFSHLRLDFMQNFNILRLFFAQERCDKVDLLGFIFNSIEP